MGKSDTSLAEDLILLCTDRVVDSPTAQKGVRALCRYFGGQMVYVPVKKDTGKSAEKIRGILADAVGDLPAQAMLDKLMLRFGGLQLYLPLERCAFLKIIALEIYERCYKNGITMNDLAREYNITANHAYTLWRKGRHEKYNQSLPFLPFLEFLQ